MTHLLIDALYRRPTPRRPIWLMRQAGRYLPEYRALRSQAGSFMTLCQNPEWAAEVTLQPLARFPLDAAIIFTDILTIPDAMGLGLGFAEGEGPYFERPIRSEADIQGLPQPDPCDELGYVMAALRRTRSELAGRVPLIGFAGSPWTLAAYMVGEGRRDHFADALRMCESAPALMDALLAKLVQAIVPYLSAQVSAGAEVLMLFDSWGGRLPEACFQRFSLDPIQAIVSAVQAQHPDVPLIVFCRQVHHSWEALASCGAQALGIDQGVSLGVAKAATQGRVALQGNLDPAMLLTDPQTIQAAVQACLTAYGNDPGHVFNLGHGITPDVPPEHVACLVEAVRQHHLPS